MFFLESQSYYSSDSKMKKEEAGLHSSLVKDIFPLKVSIERVEKREKEIKSNVEKAIVSLSQAF